MVYTKSREKGHPENPDQRLIFQYCGQVRPLDGLSLGAFAIEQMLLAYFKSSGGKIAAAPK